MKSKKNTPSEILESLIASSLDAIFAIDEQGHISVFNRKAEEILGYQTAEIIGKKLALFMRILKQHERLTNLSNMGKRFPTLKQSRRIRMAIKSPYYYRQVY
jgi:PAS domain S-box-containing protein